MKKYLPLLFLFVGLLVLGGVFFFVRGKSSNGGQSGEEVALLDLPLEERPIVSLTPTSDGHYLKFKVSKMEVPGAVQLDYVLLYQTGEGVTQGVPGSTDIEGENGFEIELLLGSESSGKFRYDEGVKTGNITLEFRNSDGRLLSKFTSDFNISNDTNSFTSPDNKFTLKLNEKYEGYAVVMEAVGLPEMPPGNVVAGPYIITTSEQTILKGTAQVEGGKTYRHVTGPRWSDENTDTTLDSDMNIYVSTSN
jgi:hypothetical protein